SDRMGYVLGAITKGKLDGQREVVQNEERQGENEPYGLVNELVTKSTYTSGHPYSWMIIGSMKYLNAASLDDVERSITTYYGAARAAIVGAGDMNAQTARQKVEKYFGEILSGPPVARQQAWVAKRMGTQRQRMEDRVPQARIYKVWNVPQIGTSEADYLELFA